MYNPPAPIDPLSNFEIESVVLGLFRIPQYHAHQMPAGAAVHKTNMDGSLDKIQILISFFYQKDVWIKTQTCDLKVKWVNIDIYKVSVKYAPA